MEKSIGTRGGEKLSNQRKSQLAFARAKRWLQSAERALEDERWDDVVYGSQMAVEHAIKSILLEKGLRFKRVHDISPEFLLLSEHDDTPNWLKEKIEEISKILLILTNRRSSAGYGFEEEVDVEDFKDEAPDSYNDAKYVLDLFEQYYNR